MENLGFTIAGGIAVGVIGGLLFTVLIAVIQALRYLKEIVELLKEQSQADPPK